MFVIGLTGSIASGKSETAKLLMNAGIPVFDADAEVHRLYQQQSVINQVAAGFPQAIVEGAIDRSELGKIVLADPAALQKLEHIVHPLVRAARQDFIEKANMDGLSFVVVDIPLLFETGEDKTIDYVVVVSAPENIRRKRAMARIGMTAEKLEAITERQMPDAEKRRRADFIIDNSGSLDLLREQVDALILKLNALPGAKAHA
jgi:dephospho-CoA kinase